MPPPYYIGLMSGTSADGIDAVLARFTDTAAHIVAQHSHPLDDASRAQIMRLAQPGNNEIDTMGELDVALGRQFAAAAQALLRQASVSADAVLAIGSHGQTVRHRPQARHPFSLQIGDPNTIATITGITTVADFRRRDMACGGQGAPLVPAFHRAVFASAAVTRVIVNIGGIANLTYLPCDGETSGFDTGPGNVLLDGWIGHTRGDSYDHDGAWAASGEPNGALLHDLLQHPFFAARAPKSTGREDFNLEYLLALLQRHPQLPANAVQATLVALTADTIANAIARDCPGCCEIYICGGGAHNSHLLSRLRRQLPAQRVATTAQLGIDPDWVEATAFAWLAKQTLDGQPGNLPRATGASKGCVLGGIYPA